MTSFSDQVSELLEKQARGTFDAHDRARLRRLQRQVMRLCMPNTSANDTTGAGSTAPDASMAPSSSTSPFTSHLDVSPDPNTIPAPHTHADADADADVVVQGSASTAAEASQALQLLWLTQQLRKLIICYSIPDFNPLPYYPGPGSPNPGLSGDDDVDSVYESSYDITSSGIVEDICTDYNTGSVSHPHSIYTATPAHLHTHASRWNKTQDFDQKVEKSKRAISSRMNRVNVSHAFKPLPPIRDSAPATPTAKSKPTMPSHRSRGADAQTARSPTTIPSPMILKSSSSMSHLAAISASLATASPAPGAPLSAAHQLVASYREQRERELDRLRNTPLEPLTGRYTADVRSASGESTGDDAVSPRLQLEQRLRAYERDLDGDEDGEALDGVITADPASASAFGRGPRRGWGLGLGAGAGVGGMVRDAVDEEVLRTVRSVVAGGAVGAGAAIGAGAGVGAGAGAGVRVQSPRAGAVTSPASPSLSSASAPASAAPLTPSPPATATATTNAASATASSVNADSSPVPAPIVSSASATSTTNTLCAADTPQTTPVAHPGAVSDSRAGGSPASAPASADAASASADAVSGGSGVGDVEGDTTDNATIDRPHVDPSASPQAPEYEEKEAIPAAAAPSADCPSEHAPPSPSPPPRHPELSLAELALGLAATKPAQHSNTCAVVSLSLTHALDALVQVRMTKTQY
jgi:hypothetical protein